MHTITKFIAAGVIAAAPLAAGVGAASADTIDEIAYIAALDDEGIYYSSADAAIELGYASCEALDSGATVTQVVNAGIDGAAGFYSDYEVGYITGAAIGAFCPEYLPAVDALN